MKPKKLLSFILATVMAISLLPTFTLTASATTATEKKITLGTVALSGYDSTNKYKYVYYGTFDNSPIKWRILSMNGNEGTYYESTPYTPTKVPTTPVDGTVYTDSDETTKFIYLAKSGEYYKQTTSTPMFLLSEYALKQMAYELAYNTDDGDGQTNSSDWRYSDAWYWCNDTTDSASFISSSFTDSEKAYFLKTSKDNTRSPYTDELKGDTFFFLSYAEADNIYTESRDLVAKMSNASGNAAWWWLRSPYFNDFVYCVHEDGIIYDYYVESTYPAARPAFNLNLSSVLFTSAANGGKSSTAAVGGGAEILKNADYTISGDEKYEYKLTMLDTSRKFEVTEKTANGTKGETITFNYENAEIGSDEYISAMIVDNNNEVLYYGQLKNISDSADESGTVDFKIPSDIDYGTYKLKLFNEQINGDYKTDYSSEFETVTLNVLQKATFTTEPKANTLTYNGKEQALVTEGITSEGTVKYSLWENGTYSETVPTGENATDYVVWYYIEGNSDHSDSDKASVKVTISQKEIRTDNARITLGDSLTYNGTEQTQTISSVAVDGLILSENTDYTVSGNKGTEVKDDYELTISGTGNFTGTATKQFAIAKADSQTTTTANATVTYGETLTLTATVEKSARTLNKVDFYVVEGENAEPLGTADVTYTDETHGTATLEVDTTQKKLKIGDNRITADYGGSVNLNGGKGDTITVTLKQKTVGLTWNDYETLVYDGNAKNVTATATGTLGNDEIGVTVTGGNETNANTYTSTATGLTGTYAEYYKLPEEDTKTYTISPKTVTATISTISDQTYTGSEIKPTITAYDDTDEISETEYDVVYSDNTEKGTATVELKNKANGNYTVSGSTTFKILPKNIDGATVGTFAEMTYNGQEQTPSAVVTIEGLTTTGEWSKVTNVSDKTTFTANGNFTGTISDVTPNMAKMSIENATLALDGELTYNGNEQTQNVTLTLDGFTNVTFDISDNKQTNVKDDDYTLTVTGTGNFEGTKTLDWNIKPYIPTENPDKKTTARVKRNRTLAEATFTEGEILGLNDMVLEGTFAWVDDTKTMSADGMEQMTFTPTDTNYAPITLDVAVSTYSSGGGGSSVTRYTVKFDTDGGSTIANQTVTKNSKATEPTKPTKEGYIFDGWYTDSEFATEYDFDTKVTKNITLYAKWFEDEIQEPSDDKKDDEPQTEDWKNPFTDVTENDWFFDNIKYANENGLMSGVTNSTFAPNDNLTRGMLVTVLYRAEGEPAVNKSIPFADVKADMYYANAVIWAEQNGIVKGVSETEFAPDENITREQIATIIYRYAEYKGIAPTGAWAIKLDYADVADISDYAVDGVMYCTMKNIMQGKDNNMFAPKDNATRAEIAAILNRFIESNK